jgi:subtilisin family serine protease
VVSFSFSDDQHPAAAGLAVVADELLVQVYPGADLKATAAAYSAAGVTVVEREDGLDLTVLRVGSDRLGEAAGALSKTALFEGIHKNYVFEAEAVPNDPLFGNQNHLTQIWAEVAWETTVGSEEIVIAIVDSGVDADHPDLKDKIIDGWNVYDNNENFDDVAGHGTEVAGLAAAATDNGTGVAGVSWLSPILAVRATDAKGRASGRHLASGILWAATNGAKVINVSFAPLQFNSLVRSAAEVAFNRGALVVISAGNGGKAYAEDEGFAEALFVGAVSGSNSIAPFSDRGPFVDLVAPGVGVRSTRMGGNYRLVSGTSFSSPIVAGAAALVWSVNPGLRPVSVQQALIESAEDFGAVGKDDSYGHGALNVASAIDGSFDTVDTEDETPPLQWVQLPKDGETVSGLFTAAVSATDSGGIADVVMTIDGAAYATDTRTPYRFLVDTAQFEPGVHALTFVATDWVGNRSESDTVFVTFGAGGGGGSSSGGDGGNVGSEVVFLSPAAGATVSGTVTIRARATDGDGLSSAEWLVDGGAVFVDPLSGKTSEAVFLWNASKVEPGAHTITLIVTDAKGARVTRRLRLTVK